MHILKLQIDNLPHAKMLAAMLSRLDFVKSINLEKSNASKQKSLTNEDWITSGRPASDEEIEKLCLEMEKDKGAYTSDEVLSFVNEGLKK